MSRYNSIKLGISILVIVTLFFAVISTAQAESSKGSQNPLLSGDTTQNGKDKNNFSPGQFTLGRLNMPMPTLRNLTEMTNANTNNIDTVRLTTAKKLASLKISLVIRQLELYKKQIAHSRLDADAKEAAIVIADNNIAWYRQLANDIQAATDLETINTLIAETNEHTDLLKVNMKMEAGIMACDQVDNRITTARKASTIAAGKIADLKASGYDTAALESSLADYNAHIDAASQYSNAARTAFESISGWKNADSEFNEGYKQIRMADLELGKAFTDLKEFYLLYLQSARIK